MGALTLLIKLESGWIAVQFPELLITHTDCSGFNLHLLLGISLACWKKNNEPVSLYILYMMGT